MRLPFRIFAAILWITVASSSFAEDWPTHLHDHARSGWSSESLPSSLAEAWTFVSAQAPETAWQRPIPGVVEGNEEVDRVDYDKAFQVSISGGRAYFGSSSDDQVYCLDLESGEILWTFFTGGPVRLAPTLAGSRLYFGSDDGKLYCLDAASGAVNWTVRLGPDDTRHLGNGRMISRWPVRTDVMVKDGVVYCGAGVFPHEGVILAAFDAASGKVVWRNDSIGSKDGNRSRFAPQGYLLTQGDRLYSPSGRDLPAAFSLDDGSMKFQANSSWRASGIVGGTYATLLDGYLLSGANQNVAFDGETGRPGFGWFTGRRTVANGDISYMTTARSVDAIRRNQYAEGTRQLLEMRQRHDGREKDDPQYLYAVTRSELRSETGKTEAQRDLEKIADLETAVAQYKEQVDAMQDEEEAFEKRFIADSTLWSVDLVAPGSLIGTPSALYAGGDGFVSALDPKEGKELWRGEVDGRAAGLAVADGHLLVSTDTGRIHCFHQGSEAKDPGIVRSDRPTEDPFPAGEASESVQRVASELIAATGIKRGFCLVLGLDTGQLTYELARNTELKIVAVESDPERVEKVRRLLAGAGLYGSRVAIIHSDGKQLPVSNLFANLVVSETGLTSGGIPVPPAEVARTVRPLGGVVALREGSNGSDQQFLQALDLGEVEEVAAGWTTGKRGALPGAGNWTHQYANEGNTSSNNETRLRAPLGVLWYGDPGPTEMINRHSQGSPPVSLDGRLFVVGREVVLAYDSYNGTKLWEQPYTGGPRLGTRSIPGAIAVSRKGVFLATQEECLQLDPVTGEKVHAFPLPEELQERRTRWSYLGLHQNVLVGSVTDGLIGRYSKAIFAYDVETRKLLWTRRGNHIAPLCIAMGDGRVFMIDSKMTDAQRELAMQTQAEKLAGLSGEARVAAEAKLKAADLNLAIALDARSGEELWSKALDLTGCTGIHRSHGQLMMMYQHGKLIFAGASGNGHFWQQFIAGEFKQRKISVVEAGTGGEIWSKEADYRIRPLVVGEEIVAEPWAYDLYTGKQKTRTHPTTGEETPWQFIRSGHHCGHVAATENLMFLRSKSTAYYDLKADNGVSHFAGMRTGCTINMIPANGLVHIPEASAGCQCLFAIQSTVTMEPIAAGQDRGWGVFTSPGPVLPVKHLRVNFGAPGDRRDAGNNLWLAWPRPSWSSSLEALEFPLEVEIEGSRPTPRFVSGRSDGVGESEISWVYSSSYESITQVSLPVLGVDDPAGVFTVRLHFADLEEPGAVDPRRFDISLQDEVLRKGFEVASKGRVLEFEGIDVFDWLEIGLVAEPGATRPPSLSGLEMVRTGDSTKPRPMSFRNPPAWPTDHPEIVLEPAADSRVSIKYPDKNDGSNGALSMDGGADAMGDDAYGMIYLKFDLSEVPGAPVAVKLRLHCLGPGSADAGTVYNVVDAWDEAAITWNQRPDRGRKIGEIGKVGEQEQIERRLALLDPESGVLSIAIAPSSIDGIRYSSREGETPPQLVVGYRPR